MNNQKNAARRIGPVKACAVVALLVLAACAPRADQIFKATEETGKVAVKAGNLIETELDVRARSLRLGYARRILAGSSISAIDIAAHQFATLACAGIPVTSAEAESAKEVRKQVGQLSAFHKSLEKFAKDANKNAERVEGAVSGFQTVLQKSDAFKVAGAQGAQILGTQEEFVVFAGATSEEYVACFSFAVESYQSGVAAPAGAARNPGLDELLGTLGPPHNFTPSANVLSAAAGAGTGVAVAVDLIQISAEFAVDAARDADLIRQIRKYLVENECDIRRALVIPRGLIKVSTKKGEPKTDPSPLLEQRMRSACGLGRDAVIDLDRGFASNGPLLDAMLERRRASLALPALTYDFVASGDVPAGDRVKYAIELHTSFSEFDQMRLSGLNRTKFQSQMAHIAFGMSQSIDGLKVITEQSFLDRIDSKRLGNALRRLMGNVSQLGAMIETFVPDTTKKEE